MSRRSDPAPAPRGTAQARSDFTAEGAPAPPAAEAGDASVVPAVGPRPARRAVAATRQRDRWGPLSRNGR